MKSANDYEHIHLVKNSNLDELVEHGMRLHSMAIFIALVQVAAFLIDQVKKEPKYLEMQRTLGFSQ